MRTRACWWFVIVCAVTLLAYARSFTSPFTLDDDAYIVRNRVLDAPTLHAAFSFARVRLVPFATIVLNHWIGEKNVLGYHIVNFVIHVLATLALYQLVLALCRSPRMRGTWLAERPLPVAVAAAFIFACHPIQIQAVTYIVQRISSLATLFYVACVLYYVRARNMQVGLETGRPGRAFATAALLALGAFLSKENSASLPATIVLTELTFYPRQGAGRRLLRLTPAFLLVLVIPLIWYAIGTWHGRLPTTGTELVEHARHFIRLIIIRAHPSGEGSPLLYFLTQCVVIPRYLKLVFLPWGLNIDHDVPLVQELSVPVAGGMAFLAVLLGFGLYACGHWPLVGYGIVWFFLALSVESSILPIQDTMVEHRIYLAMPGVALACGCAFGWCVRRWRLPTLVAGATVVAALCTLTLMRNELWRRPVLLWRDAVSKSPRKARAYANLGTALHHENQLDAAIEQYCKALALDPAMSQAEANAYTALGQKLERDVERDPSVLEDFPIGADGTVEVTLPDPCRRAALGD